ncbi:IucA/IucC family protein [Streptomyces sp. NBC_01298]|uniref:IucA/IucC family protein n=1 Tax=Streptomyces sp. NBC_01298 TaxID=2903817 RepID=UPI003FA34D89
MPWPPAEPQQPAVPRQKDGSVRPRAGAADPLDHPDPRVAAEAASVENLLRCWVRETGLEQPAGPVLRIPLPASGAALLVAVRYWSAAGWHRFGPARIEGVPAAAPAVDAVTLAALISREGEAAHGNPAHGNPAHGNPAHGNPAHGNPAHGNPAHGEGARAIGPHEHADGPANDGPANDAPNDGAPGGADLVGRVADSVRRTAEFITDRRQRPAAPVPVAGDRFLTAEQSLLLGHPLHPTPKSREGLSEAEVRRYSPELHGSFPLHWVAIAPAALATDSAWTERGRPVSAARLLGRLAPGLPVPDGATPLPLHPWQAHDLLQRPAAAALRDAGLLHDLGPYGAPWYPTSSIRTVHQPGAPAMLKLSLGLRITNSRRENLRKELHRGIEVHRLLRTGLAERWQAAHPGFDIVRDPAWVAADAPDGTPVPGLDVLLRHNPFRPGDDVLCIAALTAPRPWPGRTTMSSRLAETVSRLATTTGRTTSAVAAEWFLRYLEHVVLPVLAFDALAGIALEAHQQNTLVLLDPAGWPVGGRYRDNQGYYFRSSRRAELERRLPGIGATSDTFVSDAVTDERFAYYLGINNVLGLIGAFGSQRLADERILLAAFRRFLGKARGLGPLPERLLDSPTLRCKANLLTRLGGLDELVGPVDTQSVYVTIANPLHD